MRTGESDGIGGGQFVPHFLVMRDSRILPLAEELWVKARRNPDKYVDTVFEYVTSNVGYAFDEDLEYGLMEYVQMPFETLTNGFGDCECSSILAVSLLTAKGIPCHLTFGYAGAGSHRWPEIKYRGKWYVFDTTNGDTFPAEDRLSKGYIDLFYVTPHSFRPSWMPVPLYLP